MINALVLVGFFVIVTAVLFTKEYMDINQGCTREAESMSHMLSPQAAAALAFDDRERARDILATLSAQPHVREAVIFAPDGEVFGQYASDGFLRQKKRPSFTGAASGEGHDYAIHKAVMLDGDLVGSIYLLADASEYFEPLVRRAALMTGGLALLLGLMAYMLFVLQARAVTPMTRILGVMEHVTGTKDFSLRVPMAEGDENSSLARAFNEMLRSIEERDRELAAYRSDLEGIVASRTSELRHEIGKRAQTQERLEQALADKEVLLKEVHHRVKNNMFVVGSLLGMQARTLDDPALRQKFTETQQRIKSMSLVHELLYRRSDLEHISVREYFGALLGELRRSCGCIAAGVSTDIQIEDIQLDIDHLIPLGLVVNEIVTNAYKYAFGQTGGTGGMFQFRLRTDNRGKTMLIEVGDNGPGMKTPEGEPTTLGLVMIHSLVTQIKGSVALDASPGGVRYTITVPIHE